MNAERWSKAADELREALSLASSAQGHIAATGALHISENLKPLCEGLERFANLAAEKADA